MATKLQFDEGEARESEPLPGFVFGKIHPIWTPWGSNVSSKGPFLRH